MLRPTCLSIVNRGSSHTTSSLQDDQDGLNLLMIDSYSGNSPLHLATYSFLILPPKNSLDSSCAQAADVGIIISPDVSLSSRLTARQHDVR